MSWSMSKINQGIYQEKIEVVQNEKKKNRNDLNNNSPHEAIDFIPNSSWKHCSENLLNPCKN